MLPHSKEDSCMTWTRRHFLRATAATTLAAPICGTNGTVKPK